MRTYSKQAKQIMDAFHKSDKSIQDNNGVFNRTGGNFLIVECDRVKEDWNRVRRIDGDIIQGLLSIL